MDSEIEKLVCSCTRHVPHQRQHHYTHRQAMEPPPRGFRWSFPYRVVVDAHSKWMDVVVMPDITASQTIEKLKVIFATHGLPQIVSDNGPSFVSHQFKDFMSQNGIVHITSAPYHPSTNGLAERAVQTFKLGLKRITGSSIQDWLSKFLLHYRNPHTTTGVPPAELLMGRRLRTQLDLLFPDVSKRVARNPCVHFKLVTLCMLKTSLDYPSGSQGK